MQVKMFMDSDWAFTPNEKMSNFLIGDPLGNYPLVGNIEGSMALQYQIIFGPNIP